MRVGLLRDLPAIGR